MTYRSRLGSTLLALAFGAGCAGGGEPTADLNEDGAADGAVEINYRGQRRVAQRYGKLLLVEGDIQVDAIDIWDDGVAPPQGDGVAVTASPLKIVGASLRWPGGVVPYGFGSYNNIAQNGTLNGALSADVQAQARAAMDMWQKFVPGLVFRPKVAGDTNFLTFNSSTLCASRWGRSPADFELGQPGSSITLLPGEQIVRLNALCTATFAVHHELGHALGLMHEVTRTDRDSWVSIDWRTIRGCTNAATSISNGCADLAAPGSGACPPPTGGATTNECGCNASQIATRTCNMASQFDNKGGCSVVGCDRSNIGAYDFDSVMHYTLNGFTKNGSNTIYPLVQTPVEPGQRDHLSVRDGEAVRAMYPYLGVHFVFFRDTGNKELCRLYGRESDRFGTSFSLLTSTLPSGSTSAGNVNTNGLAAGSYNVDCQAKSAFWQSNYATPNFSVAFNPSTPAGNVETYDAATTSLHVLSRGLLPLMIGS